MVVIGAEWAIMLQVKYIPVMLTRPRSTVPDTARPRS